MIFIIALLIFLFLLTTVISTDKMQLLLLLRQLLMANNVISSLCSVKGHKGVSEEHKSKISIIFSLTWCKCWELYELYLGGQSDQHLRWASSDKSWSPCCYIEYTYSYRDEESHNKPKRRRVTVDILLSFVSEHESPIWRSGSSFRSVARCAPYWHRAAGNGSSTFQWNRCQQTEKVVVKIVHQQPCSTPRPGTPLSENQSLGMTSRPWEHLLFLIQRWA